ncbi:MAG: hypothetical protein IJ418_13905 [Clostridia bacterium]|nr:hypothetical protein [Clostridia bacterium]
MQEIIFRQGNAARPLTGRTFIMGVAGVFVHLAIAQIAVNLLVSLTGMGLLNAVFYLYAAWLLMDFMRATVAGYVYMLKEDALVLERRLGDSMTAVVEIPLERVVSLRKLHMAENLRISYRDVTHIDAASRPALRVRAAFVVSLVSSHLARLLAGRRAQDVIGHVIVYDAGSIRRACTFCPNEELLEMLEQRLGGRFGFDERMTRTKVHTLYARALERTFPALYAYVDPLVKAEDVAWAREEIARQKEARRAKKNPKTADEAGKEHEKEQQDEAAAAQQESPRRRRKQG